MDNQKLFINREDAGVKLAKKLSEYGGKYSRILALPRGGVVVALEIAKYLHMPLDVLIVRKIGKIGNPEFGIGAVAENHIVIWDYETMEKLNITVSEMSGTLHTEQKELERRMKIYRGKNPVLNIAEENIILVDDGAATGVTAMAAIRALRSYKAKNIIFALPLCSESARNAIEKEGCTVIALSFPDPFRSIGSFYENFTQVTDTQVLRTLKKT